MITIILFSLIGYSILKALKFSKFSLEMMGLGYLFGFYIVTIFLIVLSFFSIRLDAFAVTLLTYFTLVILLLINATFFRKIKAIAFGQSDRRIKIIFLPIFVVIILSFIINTFWPPITWDALTLYDFRAKLFASGHNLIDLADNVGSSLSYYYDYPPTTSYAMALSYILKQNSMYIYTGFFVSLLICFYYCLKRITTANNSAFFTLVLASAPIIFSHSMMAYTNLPYAITFSLGVLYLALFWLKKEHKFLIVGMLLCALTVWIRTKEPFYLIPATITLWPVLIIRSKKTLIAYVLLFILLLVMKIPWSSFTASQMSIAQKIQQTNVSPNPVSEISQNKIYFSMQRLIEVLTFSKQATDIYQPLIIILLITLLLNIKHAIKNLFIPLVVVLSLGVMIGGIYIFSMSNSWWKNIPDSVRRMMVFIVPLIIFYIGTIPKINSFISKFLNNKK